MSADFKQEITTLNGTVICTIQAEKPLDELLLKGAVADEIHLPGESFELISSGAVVNIVYRLDFGGWPIVFENACKTNDEVCITNAFTAMDKRETFFDFCPLHLAIHYRRPSIVKLLLDMGADPHAVTCSDRQAPPLHVAARGGDPETVLILLAGRADVNAATSDGDTPLHIAACRTDTCLVSRLLGAKADVNLENDFGETPLRVAESMGNSDVRDFIDAYTPSLS